MNDPFNTLFAFYMSSHFAITRVNLIAHLSLCLPHFPIKIRRN